jgi:hypothetical protein
LAKSTSYEAPLCAVSSSLLLFHPSSVQIFSGTPCSEIPSAYVLPLMLEENVHTRTKLQENLCLNFYVFREKKRNENVLN